MSIRASLIIVSLALAAGCGDETEADLNALQAQVQELQTAVQEQEAVNTAQEETIAALQEELDAVTGAVDLTELADKVEFQGSEILSLQDAVDGVVLDYLVSADLDGYATETWVQDQQYGSDSALVSLAGDVAANSTAVGLNTSAISTNTTNIGTNTSDIATNTTGISDNQTTSSDNATDIGANTTDIGTNESDISDLQTDLTTADGEIAALQDNVMVSSATWVVGTSSSADYASLQDALTAARKLAIRDNARLTIQVEDGTYTSSSQVLLNHNNGDRITVRGNTADPSKVVLKYTGASSFVALTAGNYIYTFSGFTLEGSGSGYGLYLNQRATGWFGNLIVDGFYYGVYVTDQSSAYLATGTVDIKNTGAYGVIVRGNSYIKANGLDVSDSGHTGMLITEAGVADVQSSVVQSSVYYGIASHYGSYVSARYSEVSSNGSIGFYAFMADMYARDTLSESNGSHGYYADVGNLYAYNSEASGNTGYGFAVDRMAHIQASATVSTTPNGSGLYQISAATGDQVSRNIEQ